MSARTEDLSTAEHLSHAMSTVRKWLSSHLPSGLVIRTAKPLSARRTEESVYGLDQVLNEKFVNAALQRHRGAEAGRIIEKADLARLRVALYPELYKD